MDEMQLLKFETKSFECLENSKTLTLSHDIGTQSFRCKKVSQQKTIDWCSAAAKKFKGELDVRKLTGCFEKKNESDQQDKSSKSAFVGVFRLSNMSCGESKAKTDKII